MADQLHISIGHNPNDGLGDDLRTTQMTAEQNFSEIFDRAVALEAKTATVGPENAFSSALKLKGTAAAWREGLGLYLPLNVKATPYSATGDGVTDDTAAIQAALDDAAEIKGAVIIPAGEYSVSTLDVSGVSMICGEGGYYREATVIKHRLGAENDLITFSDPAFRPVIRDVILKGRREQNLRNLRAISSVSSRYEFTVNSPPPTGYTKEVFFFYLDYGQTTYHFLGSGVISSVVGTTVTISDQQDWFATPAGAGGKLTDSCFACFGEVVTEDGITSGDPTRAGYAAINLTGVGAYLQLDNVRFEDWHVGIRIGAAVGLDALQTFHRAQSLAAVYCAFAAGSDHRIGTLECGGGYGPQAGITDTPTQFDNADYRRSKFGVSLSGTAVQASKLQLYTCIRPLRLYYCIPFHCGTADIASSVCEAVVVDNSSVASIDTLWLYNIGSHLTDTFSAILNVNCPLDIGRIAAFTLPAPNDAVAKYLLESLTSDSVTCIGQIMKATGYTTLEKSYDSLSHISRYTSGPNTISGSGLSGGLFVFHNPTVSYGMRMGGSGAAEDPFRVEMLSASLEYPVINVQNPGRVGILKIASNYELEVNGVTATNGIVVNGDIALARLDSDPAIGSASGRLFLRLNGSNKIEFCIRFPSGTPLVIATEP